MFVVHCRGDGIHMDDDPLPLMDGVLVAKVIRVKTYSLGSLNGNLSSFRYCTQGIGCFG